MHWIVWFLLALLVGTWRFARHMDKIREQAWLDKKLIIAKWSSYYRIYNAYYHGNGNVLVCYDEVEEARKELKDCADWYNKKYKKYGYCAPPELLLFEEEQYETSN